jgi:hypothetical protein
MNAEHRPARFFVAAEDFDFEACFRSDSIQKLLFISGISHSARRHRNLCMNTVALDSGPPVFQAVNDPIYGLMFQSFRLIDAFSQSQDSALGAQFIQAGIGRQVGNQESAGQGSDIDTGETLTGYSASRISCISASSFPLVAFS